MSNDVKLGSNEHPISEELSTVTVGGERTSLEISRPGGGARINGGLQVTGDIKGNIVSTDLIIDDIRCDDLRAKGSIVNVQNLEFTMDGDDDQIIACKANEAGALGSLAINIGADLEIGVENTIKLFDKDDDYKILEFAITNSRLSIYSPDNSDDADYFRVMVAANGATTISTVDGAGTDAKLIIDADGHVEFDGCGVGFDKISYTDATNVTVDFTTGNKAELDMAGGSISGTLSLKFPNTSGNFLLVVKQDGSTRTIAAFATLDSAGNAGDNDGGTGGAIRWAGGSAPDLTDGSNKDDILTFYWDADLEVCYGVATLNF